MELRAVIERVGELAWNEIPCEVELSEARQVANGRWNFLRDVFLAEEKSGDRAVGAVDFWPIAR